MIKSYRNSETQKIFRGEYSRRFPISIQHRARLCLERLSAAIHPADLKAFPSMRLKRLSGSRQSLYSIRVNRQYRICFEWIEGYAENVELIDYH
jgi:proteic killer suppression protein